MRLPSSYKFHTTASVLRLDEVHPIVSGNKWFKLRCWLEDARTQQKRTIVTYGGAYSNHIVATAAAAQAMGFQSVGMIRGERPALLSPTLQDAEHCGMQLFFMDRTSYRNRTSVLEQIADLQNCYVIPEGGYGPLGAQGAASILSDRNDTGAFSHIAAAVGTGTMLAGLTMAAAPHQQVIGISVLKNNTSLQGEIEALLPEERRNRFTLMHDFHFGGYAKKTTELIRFMNGWHGQTGVPSDFVYTGKLFFAAHQLMEQGYFPRGAKVLLIHSGGLQGNRSLPAGVLNY